MITDKQKKLAKLYANMIRINNIAASLEDAILTRQASLFLQEEELTTIEKEIEELTYGNMS